MNKILIGFFPIKRVKKYGLAIRYKNFPSLFLSIRSLTELCSARKRKIFLRVQKIDVKMLPPFFFERVSRIKTSLDFQ